MIYSAIATLSLFFLAVMMIEWSERFAPHIASVRVWIQRRRQNRYEYYRYFSFLLDVTAVATEAGLHHLTALKRAALQLPNSIVRDDVLEGWQLYSASGDAALLWRYISERSRMNSVRSAAALMIQAERTGVAIAPVLLRAATMMRREYRDEAERRGVIASQKILLPIFLCMVPANMIVVVMPIVISIAESPLFKDILNAPL
jgi:tight adherence protein C